MQSRMKCDHRIIWATGSAITTSPLSPIQLRMFAHSASRHAPRQGPTMRPKTLGAGGAVRPLGRAGSFGVSLLLV